MEAKLSQKMKDEIKATLAMQAKADADRAARDNAPDPFDPTKTRKQRTDELVGQALERQRRKENLDDLDVGPNLKARMRFSDQSRARSAAPGAVSGVAGQGGPTPDSDLDSFLSLSPEDQKRVAPTIHHKRIEDMRTAQYNRSTENVRQAHEQGKFAPQLGASKVNALNLIDKTIDDRNKPMGGPNGAAIWVRSWQEDPTSLRTQRSMVVRTPAERLAMNDAIYQEGLRQFRENGKLDPNHVAMVNQFAKFGPKETEVSKKFGEATREALPQSGIDAYKAHQNQEARNQEARKSTQQLKQESDNFKRMQDERRYADTNRLLNTYRPSPTVSDAPTSNTNKPESALDRVRKQNAISMENLVKHNNEIEAKRASEARARKESEQGK